MRLKKVIAASVAASALAACGNQSNAPETQPPAAESPTNTNSEQSSETNIQSAPEAQPTQAVVQSPPPVRTITQSIFDRIDQVDEEAMLDLYLYLNQELLDDKDIMEWYICRLDSTRFGEMKSNEFSYNDFFNEKSAEVRTKIEGLGSSHNWLEDGTYLIKANNSNQFGEYDFETESFEYNAIDFDYLRTSVFRSNCSAGEWYLNYPDSLPGQHRFYISNTSAVSSFTMPKETARTLIESRTQDGYVDRGVTFEYILAVPVSTLREDTGYGDPVRYDTPIYTARVINNIRDKTTLAEFKPDYFVPSE